MRKRWAGLFVFVGGLALLEVAFSQPPSWAKGEREEERLDKRWQKQVAKNQASKRTARTRKRQSKGKPSKIITPYTTTEELLLPQEMDTLRRSFITADPLFFEGRQVEEQSLFEGVARREEKFFYEAIHELETKPWWRDLLESFSGVMQYEQGYYTNYFNERDNRALWTEKPFFGLRASHWGVASVEANYFVSLERLSFERNISLDPHVLKTHGGQARFLYRPSRRFHLLFLDDMRKSNKLSAVDADLNQLTTGGEAISNRLGAEFRYFLTHRDVIDLTFDYDYSRVHTQDDLRITRGFRTKASLLRSMGPRLVLRGFWILDNVRIPNRKAGTVDKPRLVSYRNEPGLGATFALSRRVVMEINYSREFFRTRDSDEGRDGDRVNFNLNHQWTRRLRHSSALMYSKVETKRSALSKVEGDSDATFQSLTMATQFSYALTSQMSLGLTLDYTRALNEKPGSEANNRKRISVDLARPIFANRAIVKLSYSLNKNDGSLNASHLSHTAILGIQTTLGVEHEG